MNKKNILQMIATEKVEWKTLGEVADIGTGNSNKQDENMNGKYPFYVRSKNILRSSTFQFDEVAIIIPGEGGIGDIFHYIEGKYALHQRAYRIAVREELLNTKYLYYFMMFGFKKYILSKVVGATSISIRKPMLEKFRIPIPSLESQKEIVKILDKFTELEATLEATLEAELSLREKQYHYYRDKLLSLGDEVEWKPLGDIAEYSKIRIKSELLNSENYVGVDNLLPNKLGKKISNYVPDSGNSTQFMPLDILIGNIRPYLKKIWLADCVGGTNGDVLVIRVKNRSLIEPKYLYQVLADDKFFAYNMKYAKGAKMPRGDKSAILQYLVPIPSIEEQEKIVKILDKFDRLTISISEGLPKEIELRRQQYEYYREKLLSFPKSENI